MSVSYELFTDAFLQKIKEYDFAAVSTPIKTSVVNGYMKRAMASFQKVCEYDFMSVEDDVNSRYNVDVPSDTVTEIVETVSEGMVMEWFKPQMYSQDLLRNALNTKDFSQYSPAELQKQVRLTYKELKTDFTQMCREYSYNHAKLGELHL